MLKKWRYKRVILFVFLLAVTSIGNAQDSYAIQYEFSTGISVLYPARFGVTSDNDRSVALFLEDQNDNTIVIIDATTTIFADKTMDQAFADLVDLGVNPDTVENLQEVTAPFELFIDGRRALQQNFTGEFGIFTFQIIVLAIDYENGDYGVITALGRNQEYISGQIYQIAETFDSHITDPETVRFTNSYSLPDGAISNGIHVFDDDNASLLYPGYFTKDASSNSGIEIVNLSDHFTDSIVMAIYLSNIGVFVLDDVPQDFIKQQTVAMLAGMFDASSLVVSDSMSKLIIDGRTVINMSAHFNLDDVEVEVVVLQVQFDNFEFGYLVGLGADRESITNLTYQIAETFNSVIVDTKSFIFSTDYDAEAINPDAFATIAPTATATSRSRSLDLGSNSDQSETETPTSGDRSLNVRPTITPEPEITATKRSSLSDIRRATATPENSGD